MKEGKKTEGRRKSRGRNEGGKKVEKRGERKEGRKRKDRREEELKEGEKTNGQDKWRRQMRMCGETLALRLITYQLPSGMGSHAGTGQRDREGRTANRCPQLRAVSRVGPGTPVHLP